jgi:hypothetical protein
MPIGDGRKVVAAAGTREQLSTSSVGIRSVDITALSTNTAIVVVGGPTVVAAAGTRRGVALAAGQTQSYDADQDLVDDLNQVWLDAVTSGEGVSYAYTYEA